MPVALPLEEGFPGQQKGYGYPNMFAEAREFTPPHAGRGGILPAQSDSNEKRRRGGPTNNLTPLKSNNNGSGKLSMQFLTRAMDRCNSPRAMSLATQYQSPRASRRSYPMVCFDVDEVEEDYSNPGAPETPVRQSPAFASGAASGSPPKSPLSPMAEAADDQAGAIPKFIDSAAKSPQVHCSPGGFGRATRRPVLKFRSGLEPATPGSVMRSAWKNGRGTVRYGDVSSPGPMNGAKTPQTGRRVVFGDEDGVQPTKLLGTFDRDYGEYGDKTPHFTPDAKFMQYGSTGEESPVLTPSHNLVYNAWSPKDSPSSVGSIPIWYDEEEYGFDRPDLDYSQYDYLKEMIPPPAFSVKKPNMLTIDTGDDSDEEELTATPRATLFGTPKGSEDAGECDHRLGEEEGQLQASPSRAGGGNDPSASMRRQLFTGGAPSIGRCKSKPPRRPRAAGQRPIQRGSRLQQATSADDEGAGEQPNEDVRFDRQKMCRGVLATDMGLPVVDENREACGDAQYGIGRLGAGRPASRPFLGRSKSYGTRPGTAPEPGRAGQEQLEIRSKENMQSDTGRQRPLLPRPPSARPWSANRRPLGALVASNAQQNGSGEAPSLSVVGRSMSSNSARRPVFREAEAPEGLLPPIQPQQEAAPASEGPWAAPRPPSAGLSSIPSLPRLDRRFSAKG